MEKFKKWRKERRATANASRQTPPRYETDPPPEPIPTHVHRFGIKVLHDCPDPVVDICFIHGLTGDRDKTWTAIGQTTPWPKTLLPSKLDARILSYGYNAHITQKSVASSNRLIDHAQNLLGDLTADRGFCNASSRPLIFVAHSLGGLVCKKTILLSQNSVEPHSREIFNCLKGVVFMGTPHRGAWMADWAKIPASVFGIIKSANVMLLDILQRDNQLLDSIQVDFLTMIRRLREGGRGIHITCFFEELPFPIVGKVVTQESATLDGYEIYSIYANHRDMVRFGSEEDPGFKRLLWQLHSWTSQVGKQNPSALSVNWPLTFYAKDQNCKIEKYALDAEDRACIRDLQTTDPRDDKTRIEATKGGLLRESYRWVLSNDKFLDWKLPEKGPKILWINGDPGKGKTMLICGILDEISPASEGIICFFFCQATDTRLNTASAVLQGLLSMVIEQEPSLVTHVRQRYDVSGKQLFDGPNTWQALSKIFLEVLDHIESACLIVDALDECTTGMSQLLDLITQMATTYTNIKWIVSSRGRPDIKSSMDTIPVNKLIELKLDDKCISDAVKVFIKKKVQQLAKLKKYTQQIFDAVYSHLVLNAQETFLWVALVCEKLGQVPRIKTIERLTAFPSGLDALYRGMLQQVCEQEDATVYKSILALIATLERPISIAELVPFIDVHCDLLDDDYECVEEMIGYCGSFLKIVQKTIFFVHQSAKDYLIEKGASHIMPKGVASQHRIIFLQSLKAIHETVRRDNWGLKSPGVSIDHAEARKPHPDPLERVGYSCVYWIDHLLYCQPGSAIKDSLNDKGKIDQFLSQKFLNWLEALSLLGHIPKGLAAMCKLESLLKTSTTQDAHLLSNRIHDACRFIQYFRLVIQENPLQVYYSPLVFSPSQSMTRVAFQEEAPDWIIPEPEVTAWGPCLQTLEGHSYSINFLSQSPDGSLCLSSSMDGAIKLWDVTTGGCTLQLDGHCEEIAAVLWSQDGLSLVSASHDKTIKIWNLSSGKCTLTLEGHSEWVTSLSWSPDGKNIISVSDDMSVKFWESASGCCTETVVHKADRKLSVLWPLSETTRLITVTNNDEIKVMDLPTGKYIATLEEPLKDIDSIMGLGDGFRLILTASHSRQIMWNLSTGNITALHEEGFTYNLKLRKLSFDGKRLASSIGFDISIWDLSRGKRISTLSRHLGTVQSMVWFHDGRIASSYSDHYIKIWDSCSGQCLSTFKGHHGSVQSLLLSHDESRLISASIDKTIKIWDLDPQERHEGSECEIHSISKPHNAKFFGVMSDQWVKILDPATGQCVSRFEAQNDYILQTAWCYDSLLAIVLRDANVIKLWNPDNGNCILEFTFGGGGFLNSISGSFDGTLLSAVGGFDPVVVKTWGSVTGECLSSTPLEANGMPGSNISWSIDGKKFASVSNSETIDIYDASTGQPGKHLQGHRDPDRSEKVWRINKHGLIQDPFSGQWISVMESYSIWNKIVQNTFLSWSKDGKWLASASLQTTKIWDVATGHCALTLDIGRHAGVIEFSGPESRFLDTSIGSFDLDTYLSTPAPAAGHLVARPQPQGYGLSDDYAWITWSGVNFLWLPPDYRPESFKQTSIHGNIVVIGCVTGQVLALRFTKEGPF